MTMFRIGQKVVCVDSVGALELAPNNVYVITDILFWLGKVGLRVNGANPSGDFLAFKSERFRPVATTDISWAHKLVADLPKSKTLIDS